jgi:hypothetical protein
MRARIAELTDLCHPKPISAMPGNEIADEIVINLPQSSGIPA